MDELIRFDQQLLLTLNGSDSTYLDNIFLFITNTGTWIPLLFVLLYILFKNRPWREVLFFIVALAIVILIADRFASGLCKPLFHRFRPSHEPLLDGLVDLVDDRRGGLYGFISSHASNTFSACMFISMYLRRRPVTWILIMWACLSSYSRIYLGLHYPGDILAGTLWGLFAGWGVFMIMRAVASRFNISLSPGGVNGPTILGRSSTPDGIADSDVHLFVFTFILTIASILLLSI